MSLEIILGLHTKITSLGYGVPVYVNVLPETPHRASAIVSTGGFELPSDPVKRPSFQFLHRDTVSNSAYYYIDALARALADESQWNAAGCRVPGRLVRSTPPGIYFRDANGHFIYTLNYVYVTTNI
jgi:hypothetical protein